MARKKPSASALESDEIKLKRIELWIIIANGFFQLARPAVWFVGLSLLSYYLVALPIFYSAGKVTTVHFVYKAIVNSRLDFIASVGAAMLFGGLWYRERRLKRADIKRLHRRIKELEELRDLDRLSSGLTETGDTPND